jgi:hypothetical protein
MNLFEMIRAPGYIYGPGMLITCLIALVICLRSTRSGEPFLARRQLVWSIAPLLVAVVGVIHGCIAVVVFEDGPIPAGGLTQARKQLGYTLELGVLFSSIPLLWSAMISLRRSRPQCS